MDNNNNNNNKSSESPRKDKGKRKQYDGVDYNIPKIAKALPPEEVARMSPQSKRRYQSRLSSARHRERQQQKINGGQDEINQLEEYVRSLSQKISLASVASIKAPPRTSFQMLSPPPPHLPRSVLPTLVQAGQIAFAPHNQHQQQQQQQEAFTNGYYSRFSKEPAGMEPPRYAKSEMGPKDPGYGPYNTTPSIPSEHVYAVGQHSIHGYNWSTHTPLHSLSTPQQQLGKAGYVDPDQAMGTLIHGIHNELHKLTACMESIRDMKQKLYQMCTHMEITVKHEQQQQLMMCRPSNMPPPPPLPLSTTMSMSMSMSPPVTTSSPTSNSITSNMTTGGESSRISIPFLVCEDEPKGKRL